MRSAVAALAALGLWPGVGNAAEPAALDEEFLEYLAEFESDGNDWTWFAPADEHSAGKDEVKDAKPASPKPPPQAQDKVDP